MKRTVAIVRNHVPRNASPEVADVINQSRFVGKTLRDLGFSVIEVELGTDLDEVVSTLKGIRPDVVFNLVESILDADELANVAPVIYRKLGLAFTGADSAVLYLTSDKLVAKRYMLMSGLPTPEGVDENGLRRGRFPGPGKYIVKSRSEHASFGLDEGSVVTVDSADALRSAMLLRKAALGGSCLAERFIEGREFSVSLLEGQERQAVALGAAEIVFDPKMKVKIVGFDAKWHTGSDADLATVRSFAFRKSEPDLAKRLCKAAQECWDELGLRGYARVDFRVDGEGNLYIIDINANPCLSEDAGFMATAREAGWGPKEVFGAIVEGALHRNGHMRKAG